MRGISLHQPMAQLIAMGLKTHDFRDRRTNYRGPVAIHAGRAWTDLHRERAERAWRLASERGLHFPLPPPTGVVVALADLADCLPSEDARPSGDFDRLFGDWTTAGRWAWRLENVRPLAEGYPIGGSIGLFLVPGHSARAIEARAAEESRRA